MRAAYIACLVLLAALTAASAADLARHRTAARLYRVAPLPIAPESLSASVLASDYCWRSCAANCGAHVRRCARRAGVTECLPYNDSCDRLCVKQCRTYGGPLLGWTE